MDNPIQSRDDLVNWIDACVLGDLRTLVLGIQHYHSRPWPKTEAGRSLGGGNFLLAAGACMALEYFGFIYRGSGSDEANVLVYIQDFLMPINTRYSEVGLLMWKAFRHGIIHRSWPLRIYVTGDCANRLVVGVGTEPTDPHLDADPALSEDSFMLNAVQLLADIQSSFDNAFRHWILHDMPDDTLARANPQPLEIPIGATPIVAQIENVRRWRRGRGVA